MALSEMQVFNDYVMPATIETLDIEIEKFNAASGNTIMLTPEGFDGDHNQESFWGSVHGASRRVNRYGANDPVAVTPMAQMKKNSVKIGGGFGPLGYEPSQLTWLRKPTAEAIEMASRNFAEILLRDQLHTAIGSLVAALANNAGTFNDLGANPVNYIGLNQGHKKFGDQSSMLVAEVMHSNVRHELIDDNLKNAERLFVANGVTVVDILGKLAVVTDAPALFDGTFDNVLSLTNTAAMVHSPNNIVSNIETNNGKERIETTIQMDYDFGLGLKGFSFADAIKSPTNAQLETGTNWTKVVTSDRHTAGVLTRGTA